MDVIQASRRPQNSQFSRLPAHETMPERNLSVPAFRGDRAAINSMAQQQASRVNAHPLGHNGSESIAGSGDTDNDWTERNFLPGNHRYEHTSPAVCNTSDNGCTVANVVDTLNKVGVHPNQTRQFVPGRPYVGDVDIPGPFGVDEVRSTALYNSKNEQIGVRNETLDNHALHPGVVQRSVTQVDSSLHIYTEGGGFGYLGGPNVWFDNLVWGEVDQRVIGAFGEK